MQPQSQIITTAGQTIDIAESITYVYDQVNEAIEGWKLVTLTQIKFNNNTVRDQQYWETRDILINPDNISTIWPYDGWTKQ